MSKLVEHRERQNLTQEELSKKSGISVRTIQRVESGVDPKGFTLKALAKALNIDETNLIEQKPLITESDQKWVKIINLSSLVVVFIPVLNFALPLIIALSKKQLNALTRQIITLQILWTLLWLTIFLLGNVINLGELGRDIGIAFMVILVLANAFIILRNSAELNKNTQLFFSLKFSLI